MSERIRGSYDDALYKSTFTLLYFTLLISHPTEGRRLTWPGWLVTYRGVFFRCVRVLLEIVEGGEKYFSIWQYRPICIELH